MYGVVAHVVMTRLSMELQNSKSLAFLILFGLILRSIWHKLMNLDGICDFFAM